MTVIAAGKFANYTIMTGTREAPKWGGQGSALSAFTCRVSVGKGRSRVTRIGWTLDSRTCQYVYKNRAISGALFDILVRKPSNAYKLDLKN